MNCQQIEDNLFDYFDGQTDSSLSSLIKEHFKECSSCQKLAEEVRKSYAVIETEKKMNPSDNLIDSIMLNIDRQKPEVNTSNNVVVFIRPLVAAASIAVGIFMGSQVFNLMDTRNSQSLTDKSELYYFNDLQQESVEYSLMRD